jgi:phosphate transport system permease protein
MNALSSTSQAVQLRRIRQRYNRISIALCSLATLFGVGWLIAILTVLLWKGISGLSWMVFSHTTPPPGQGGGLLNAIVGSALMTVFAIVIGTPIGLLAGTYLAEYGRSHRITSIVRFANDILQSAPSIIVGLFIYEVIVTSMGHFSAWAGAVALSLLMIPTVISSTESMLRLVPDQLREAASALGAPRAHVILSICYRTARSGLGTGVLLAIARISGEAAPLLFTALNNQFWSTNLSGPMASLPVVIYQFALSPYENWQNLAWAGALIITMTVLTINITARLFTPRISAF